MSLKVLRNLKNSAVHLSFSLIFFSSSKLGKVLFELQHYDTGYDLVKNRSNFDVINFCSIDDRLKTFRILFHLTYFGNSIG